MGLLGCAIVALAMALAASMASGQVPDPELQRARSLLQEGDLAEARAVLDGIVERRPDDSEARMLLGRVALGMGDVEAARTHLDRAEESSPRFPFMLHYSRAMLDMALHDFGAGREELDACLALAPRFGLARVARARARLFLADVAGARDDLEAALSGPDPPPAAALLLAELELLQGQGDRAVARFRELADSPAAAAVARAAAMYVATLGGRPDETAPRVRAWLGANLNDAHAYFWLGLVEGARGEVDTATSLLRTALAIDDQHAPSLIALRGLDGSRADDTGRGSGAGPGGADPTTEGPLPPPYPGLAWEMGTARAALADGRTDEAAAIVRGILAVRPRFVPARLLLARLAETRGDLLAAMGHVVELRRLLPDLPQVLVRHATLARRVRAWDVAEEAVRRALQLTEETSEGTSEWSERGVLHYLLGTVLAGRGEVGAAVEALRRAIGEGYDEAAVWVELGNLLYERQDIAGAVEALRRAVDRDPAAAEHVASFALTAMTAEDTREVRDILEAYRADHPDDPNTLYALGSLYLRQGELERAEEALERLRALQPERSQVLYNLATVYRRQGRAEDAEATMDEFRRLKSEEERLWEEHNRAFRRRREAADALEAGDAERAIGILAELVQGVGAEPEDLLSLGRAHLRAGDPEAAGRWLRRALEASPHDPQVLCAAAAAAERLGEPPEAERLGGGGAPRRAAGEAVPAPMITPRPRRSPMTPSRFPLALRSLLAALVVLPAVASPTTISASPEQSDGSASLSGFLTSAAGRQAGFEEAFHQGISAARIEEHLRWLSSRPHPPGSEGARLTAEYVRDRLREYGWEAEIEPYEAWLTLPVSTSVEMLEPRPRTLPTIEEPIEGDPFTEDVADHPGWNGYSASGDVAGQVVYAHHGSTADFGHLRELGIDVAGKVVLMRYFGTGEGRKVHNAERFGAAGVLLYADPAEDGYPFGLVYPDGNWRPPGSIMRRSVEFSPFSGDPLSPGFASVPGAERLDPGDERVGLPGIPVVPISYASAETILREVAGPVAPAGWQGRLPLTYRLGPGPAKVRLRAEMDNGDRPMLNVVARLEGEVAPDEWVVVGNHHDAWIYGAGDPSSGTAAVLEMARVLGELAAQGHRPRRTLVIGVWDAEEMLLGGSTEWLEDHRDELLAKAVADINMDSAIFNADRPLRVAAHTTLHRLFREVARDLVHPRTGAPLFETWTDMQNATFHIPSVDGYGLFLNRDEDLPLQRPWIFEVPSDDAAPFYQYLALPASDMYYGGDYGMYHSVYENFHWMKTVVDPDFSHHVLMAQLQGTVALRLASAEVPPLDYAAEARFWRLAYRDLAAAVAARGQRVPRLDEALELIDEWEREAEALWETLQARLHAANRAVMTGAAGGSAGAEETGDAAPSTWPVGYLPDDFGRDYFLRARDFYRPEGSPGRPWNNNLFAGSAHDLEAASGSTLRGLRFALDEGDAELAASEAELYLEALSRRVDSLRSLRQALGTPASGSRAAGVTVAAPKPRTAAHTAAAVVGGRR